MEEKNCRGENIQRWIVDTDPGTDDMMAILYLLGKKNNEIVLMTTVDGNVSCEKVTINARKIIKLAEKRICLAKGAEIPLIKSFENETGYHFCDGLGNLQEMKTFAYEDVELSRLSGILKIVETVQKYPKEINFLCLAPLTNLAMAYMIYPDIVDNIKHIYLMGGSSRSLGNHIPSAEFNIAYDFISAKLVFEKFRNIIITPWEPTVLLHYNGEILERLKNNFEANGIKYNQKVFYYTQKIMEIYDKKRNGTEYCDFYSIVPAFNKNSVKKFFIADIDISHDSMETVGTFIITNKKEIKNMSFAEFIESDLFYNLGSKKIYFEEMDEIEVLKEFSSIFTQLV